MRKKGKDNPDFIVKPEWFTKEWFMKMKRKGVTNEAICKDHLFVSTYTLRRFMREIGIKPYYMGLSGRPKTIPDFVTYEYIDNLRKKGWTFTRIATALEAPLTSIRDVYYPRRVNK